MREPGVAGLSFSPGRQIELCELGTIKIEDLVIELERKQLGLEVDIATQAMRPGVGDDPGAEIAALKEQIRELEVFCDLLKTEQVDQKAKILVLVWWSRPARQNMDYPDATRILTNPHLDGQNPWADALRLAYAEFAEVADEASRPAPDAA